MFVSWSAGSASTPGSAPKPRIRWGVTKHYGKAQDAEGVTVPIPSRTYYTQPSGDVDDTVYLHTLLEGLEPDTTYHYSVSNDGGRTWFADTTFTTAHRGYPDFRWVGTGDEYISDASSLPVAQVISSFKPKFTVVAGDLSYASGGVLLPSPETGELQGQPGYTPSNWDQYFNIYGLNAAQSIPWLIGVGNHEMEPLSKDGYQGCWPIPPPVRPQVGFASDVDLHLRQRRLCPARRQRPLRRDQQQQRLYRRAPDGVAGPDAVPPPRSPVGCRLHRGLVPQLRLLH